MKRPNLLFVLCFLVLCLVYSYASVLFMRPQSIHQWAQCDRASIALNYYMDNNSFLQPAMNNLQGDLTGKGMSELPLIQYTMAQLWKVFGFHEWMYRALEMLLLFCGLYCLFLTFRLFVKNIYLCLAGTVLVFTSPILVYYGNNFLADVPSLSLSFVGWYFFFLWRGKGRQKHFFISVAVFTLAGLLKISSLINLICIAGIYVLELWPRIQLGNGRKIFKEKMLTGIGLGVPFAAVAAWYAHADSYNAEHKSNVYLTGTHLFWKSEKKMHVWEEFIKNTPHSIYHFYFLWLIILMFIFLLVNARKNMQILNYTVATLFLGALSFFLVFYDSFEVHDYYLVNLLVFPAFLFLSFFNYMEKNHSVILRSRIFMIMLCLIIGFNAVYASMKMYFRYYSPKMNANYGPVMSKNELGVLHWMHGDYQRTLKGMETIQAYNRAHGIQRDDRVIVLGDISFNIALYLMDQKGFTFNKTYDIKHDYICSMIKDYGVKYIYICNKDLDTIPDVQHFMKNKIGEYGSIEVYKVDNKLCE